MTALKVGVGSVLHLPDAKYQIHPSTCYSFTIINGSRPYQAAILPKSSTDLIILLFILMFG
jgi:hypothetical protein